MKGAVLGILFIVSRSANRMSDRGQYRSGELIEPFEHVDSFKFADCFEQCGQPLHDALPDVWLLQDA